MPKTTPAAGPVAAAPVPVLVEKRSALALEAERTGVAAEDVRAYLEWVARQRASGMIAG